MNQAVESEESPGGASAGTLAQESHLGQLRPAFISVLLLTLLTGCIFPLVLVLSARLFFARQAGGSLLMRDGLVIGSELIGQSFSKPAYFHPRPSAAGSGYDASSSGGTNLGPRNPKLKSGTADGSFAGVKALAQAYRRQNGLDSTSLVPIDAVTRSGSGLDPHITTENAALQVSRVARARGLSEATVRQLVEECTQGPQLGFLGRARVSVLTLNLALDRVSGGDSGARKQ